MTLNEANTKAKLAITAGLAGQLILFALILIGLLSSLAEAPSHSQSGFDALSSNISNLGAYALASIPGALWLSPIAPKYYPGQLEGNLYLALVFGLFAGTSALRNWGSALRREVKIALRKRTQNQWVSQGGRPAHLKIDNVENIYVSPPTPKDWWTRPIGIVALAIAAGLVVELVGPMLK